MHTCLLLIAHDKNFPRKKRELKRTFFEFKIDLMCVKHLLDLIVRTLPEPRSFACHPQALYMETVLSHYWLLNCSLVWTPPLQMQSNSGCPSGMTAVTRSVSSHSSFHNGVEELVSTISTTPYKIHLHYRTKLIRLVILEIPRPLVCLSISCSKSRNSLWQSLASFKCKTSEMIFNFAGS
eukprot:c43320_g1_i1 orf=178-717(+)